MLVPTDSLAFIRLRRSSWRILTTKPARQNLSLGGDACSQKRNNCTAAADLADGPRWLSSASTYTHSSVNLLHRPTHHFQHSLQFPRRPPQSSIRRRFQSTPQYRACAVYKGCLYATFMSGSENVENCASGQRQIWRPAQIQSWMIVMASVDAQ